MLFLPLRLPCHHQQNKSFYTQKFYSSSSGTFPFHFFASLWCVPRSRYTQKHNQLYENCERFEASKQRGKGERLRPTVVCKLWIPSHSSLCHELHSTIIASCVGLVSSLFTIPNGYMQSVYICCFAKSIELSAEDITEGSGWRRRWRVARKPKHERHYPFT